jgi:hypothetical protein
MPALLGLTCLTTETAVARFFGVGQSTINDWTNGKRGISGARIWFATRLLAFHIEEAKEMLALPQFTAQQKLVWNAKIRAAEVWLSTQEEANQALTPEDKRAGRALYESRQAVFQSVAQRARRPKPRKHETRVQTPQLGGEGLNTGSEKSTNTTPKKRERRHARA